MSEPEPEVFTRYGADLLGPWAELAPDVRAAWLQLAHQADVVRALREAAERQL